MKRPLVVITAGFVLGEVLALCLQEAVYRIFFWFAGVLFLTVLAVRRFLSRSVMYRTLLLIFVFVFGGRQEVFQAPGAGNRWSRKKRGLSRQDLGMWCS